MKYDVIIIGAGPGGIFAAYELMKKKPDCKIAVFEEGYPLEKRKCPIDGEKVKSCINCKRCSIMCGFGGAGAFSDGKYNITNDFGGTLFEYIGKKQAVELMKYVDEINMENGGEGTKLYSTAGTKFKNVPDVCIVFISKFDIFKGKSPIYHVDRVVRETGAVVDNGFEEIYVNTKVRNGSDVSELMRIFVEDNAYSTRFPKTSEIKRRYKIVDGGGDMGSAIERFKQEGRMEVFAKLLEKNLISYSEAADMADMTEEDFKKKYDEYIKENTHASEEQL
jgi:ferredoxin